MVWGAGAGVVMPRTVHMWRHPAQVSKTLLPASWLESGQARSFCERVTAAATVVVLPLMVTALIWALVRLVAR